MPWSGELSESDWARMRALIHRCTGIALCPSKKALLVARLTKRLAKLGVPSMAKYADLVEHHDPRGHELQELINCITTNKTEFFREPDHFDTLRDWCQMRQRSPSSGGNGFRIWSAACSTGEEAYTIAAVLFDTLSKAGWLRTQVTASDIDTVVLAKAAAGRYPIEAVEDIPHSWRAILFEAGTNGLRVREALRARVRFVRNNIVLDAPPFEQLQDVVFCRNALIYFDAPTRARVIQKLTGVLKEGGLLFLGHAEALSALPSELTPFAPSVYRKVTSAGRRQRLSAARLEVGSSGWTSLEVRRGFLFVVRSATTGVCVVGTVPRSGAPEESRTSIERALHEVGKGPFEIKIVHLDPTRSDQAAGHVTEITSSLRVGGLAKATEAVETEPFEAWADFGTGRIVVRTLRTS